VGGLIELGSTYPFAALGENRLKASLAYGISFGNQREEPDFVTGGTSESSGGAGRMVEGYFTFWEK